MKNIRYSIYLPENLIQALKDHKKQVGVPVCESIRRGILMYLAEKSIEEEVTITA